ncbi:MAG: hypothetical protein JNM56_23720 [Planctomycetia bacterium]|nr:hypothetical protein [Planctomycetia bacterium]
MILTVSTPRPMPAGVVWSLVKQTATFQYVARGVLRFSTGTDLPDEWQEGRTICSRLVLLGFLPAWVHELQVTGVDDERQRVRTAEKGGLLRRWDHTLAVEPDGEERCTYTDTAVLEAGVLTPTVWLVAWGFFRYRQWRLRRWVRLHAAVPPTGKADHA